MNHPIKSRASAEPPLAKYAPDPDRTTGRIRPAVRRAVLLVLLVVFAVWLWQGNSRIRISRHSIADEKIPAAFSGFRMAQVSDLHNKDWQGQLIRLLEQAAPDVIFLTGDLVDSSHLDLTVALDFARQAVEIAPVWFVSGNHEAWSGRYDELREGLEKAGVRILANEMVSLERSGESIRLIGIEDPAFFAPGTDSYEAAGAADQILEDLAPGPAAFSILLAHRPELLAVYGDHHFDLVLSGHAHGGQFRLPLLGGLYAPGQGFFPDYDAGLYRSGGTSLIVSRGLGSSVIPIRINNPPELVLIELRPAAE